MRNTFTQNARQVRTMEQVRVPVGATALAGQKLSIEGNMLSLFRGFSNPNSKVYASWNVRNESKRIELLPGRIYPGTFDCLYLWTSVGTSKSLQELIFEYSTDLLPSAMGTLRNPVYTQQRRPNALSQATSNVALGGNITISLDDPMVDYYELYFVVLSGVVAASLMGAATTASLCLAADPTRLHRLPIVGNTCGFYGITDAEVSYAVVGRSE